MAKRVRPVERLMMRPPSAISGSSFWVRKKVPLRWMLSRVSNCSSVVCSKLA
jgi:hypothetical protein